MRIDQFTFTNCAMALFLSMVLVGCENGSSVATPAVSAEPTVVVPTTVPLEALLDGDGDSVLDTQDRCANTPEGRTVGEDGCESDKDGDGVVVFLDHCPETPAGTKVDVTGCSVLNEVMRFMPSLVFSSGSASLNEDDARSKLGPFMEQARLYKLSDVKVFGYTDNRGSAALNLALSAERAAAVQRLIEGLGIAAPRIEAVGRGDANPIAVNTTEEGRAQNRRIEIRLDPVSPTS